MPKLPELDLSHLDRMTDDTGIIQHAFYGIPDRRTGYTTDDNARAFLVALKLHELYGSRRAEELAAVYLAFLCHAQREDGRFHNFMDYERRFVDEVGSEDCFGRCLWALGYCIACRGRDLFGVAAAEMFRRALPWVERLRAPRGKAFSLRGLYHYWQAHPDSEAIRRMCTHLANDLVMSFRRNSGPEWQWFERQLTYDNGILPSALMVAYRVTGKATFLEVGRKALEFLHRMVMPSGILEPIGNRGWATADGYRAEFDQQPLEAGSMVDAYLCAWNVTKDTRYLKYATQAFGWFLGRNRHGIWIYDSETGGCRDGLTPTGLNLNQGAESLLTYLWAWVSLQEVQRDRRSRVAGEGR